MTITTIVVIFYSFFLATGGARGARRTLVVRGKETDTDIKEVGES